jgi:hypothetical protein
LKPKRKSQIIEYDFVFLLGEVKVKAVLENFQKGIGRFAVSRWMQQLFFQIFINDGKGDQFHK